MFFVLASHQIGKSCPVLPKIVLLSRIRCGRNDADKVKLDGYTSLFRELSDNDEKGDVEVKQLEDNLALFLRGNPLFALQFLLTIYVFLSFGVEWLLSIPQQFISKLRENCLYIIIAIKLLDILKYFQSLAKDIHGAPPDIDLYEQAANDIKVLIKSQPSQMLAFSLVSLLSGAERLSILPFMISELPYLFRSLAIIALAISPNIERKEAIRQFSLKCIFQSPIIADTETTSVSNRYVDDQDGSASELSRKGAQRKKKGKKNKKKIKSTATSSSPFAQKYLAKVNEIFDLGSYIVQVYISLRISFKIIHACSMGTSTGPTIDNSMQVKGPSDVAFLMVQLLILVNFMGLRTVALMRDNEFVTGVCLSALGLDLVMSLLREKLHIKGLLAIASEILRLANQDTPKKRRKSFSSKKTKNRKPASPRAQAQDPADPASFIDKASLETGVKMKDVDETAVVEEVDVTVVVKEEEP